MTLRRPKTQKCLQDRELNQARWKPDTVKRPVRTVRTFVHHYNSTQYCNTKTVFFQYSPSSRPTSHLRCGQVEVRGDITSHLRCSEVDITSQRRNTQSKSWQMMTANQLNSCQLTFIIVELKSACMKLLYKTA